MIEFDPHREVLSGPAGELPVAADDQVTRKLAMLLEGHCNGLGATAAARKYGYSKQRYYQLLKAYRQGGGAALESAKRGPKTNYRRTPQLVQLVVRQRFLDPDASAAADLPKADSGGLEDLQTQRRTRRCRVRPTKKNSTPSGRWLSRSKSARSARRWSDAASRPTRSASSAACVSCWRRKSRARWSASGCCWPSIFGSARGTCCAASAAASRRASSLGWRCKWSTKPPSESAASGAAGRFPRRVLSWPTDCLLWQAIRPSTSCSSR